MRRPKLSSSTTGQEWLEQFSEEDRPSAAAMLDTLVLLNEEQVSVAIRGLLHGLAAERKGARRRVALYAEREFPERYVFEVRQVPDAIGVVRRRAVGRSGPAAVKPVRGSARVGSEGLIAFIISQAVEASPRVYVNQPGPDRIRSVRSPISALVIVTDFIGSGARVRTMLDKFWNVPSVRAWVSRRWVEFMVVAAASTSAGIDHVHAHRLKQRVLVEHIVPTIFTARKEETRKRWLGLIQAYGPKDASDIMREGFRGGAALIAFNYRIPNNTPLFLHQSSSGWRALYTGAAPEDLRPAFGLEPPEQRIDRAAAAIGVELAISLSVPDAQTVLALSAVRGRWREGAETAIAEMTGLTVPDLITIRREATKAGLLRVDGRLTDAGQATLRAGTRSERKRPDIPTVVEPYYPESLRVPRERSSVRRPSRRP
jgi:hypothetical protein